MSAAASHDPPALVRRPLLGYRLLVGALSPALLGWVVHVALGMARRKDVPDPTAARASARDFMRQRFGYPSRQAEPISPEGTPVDRRWLHAASVVEVLAALPLI